MGKKDFEEFLAKERENTNALRDIDRDKRKKEWIEYLEKFYQQIEGFLKEYIESEDISREYKETDLNDEMLGNYSVNTMHIRIRGRDVILEPVGTYVIGARGRVDMRGPGGTVRFVLIGWDVIRVGNGPKQGQEPDGNMDEWVWKIATPPPRIRYLDLNADSFLDALMEVINA